MKELVKEDRTEGWIKETKDIERKMKIDEEDLTGKKRTSQKKESRKK